MQAHKAGRRTSMRRSSLAKSRRLAGGGANGRNSSRRQSRRTSRLGSVNEATGRKEKRRSTVVYTPGGSGNGGGGILETLIGHAKDGAWKDGAFRKTRLNDARNTRYEQVHGHQSSEDESDGSDWDDDI